MAREKIRVLDGTFDEQVARLKEFFGLSPDQTFQDLDVDGDDEDEKSPDKNSCEKSHVKA